MKEMKNDAVLLKADLKYIFIVDIISLNSFSQQLFPFFWISNGEINFSTLSYKHLFIFYSIFMKNSAQC